MRRGSRPTLGYEGELTTECIIFWVLQSLVGFPALVRDLGVGELEAMQSSSIIFLSCVRRHAGPYPPVPPLCPLEGLLFSWQAWSRLPLVNFSGSIIAAPQILGMGFVGSHCKTSEKSHTGE